MATTKTALADAVSALPKPWRLLVAVLLFVLGVVGNVVGLARLVLDTLGRAEVASQVLVAVSKPNWQDKLVDYIVAIPPALPWVVGLLALGILIVGIYLMQFATQRGTAAASPTIRAKAGGWKPVASPSTTGYPGLTKLYVPADQPMQTVTIAPGNFQEVSWGGANMRITYTGQYRDESTGVSAVQLRIEATRGLLGAMPFDAGSNVASMGQGLYILPEGAANKVSGIVTAIDDRCVYHHDMSSSTYLTFVLYVWS